MRYAPSRRQYQLWASTTIVKLPSRATVAGWIRQIRREEGNAEAQKFIGYLLWLGSYPVILKSERTYGPS